MRTIAGLAGGATLPVWTGAGSRYPEAFSLPATPVRKPVGSDKRFVALIHADLDGFHADCFYEFPEAVPGFGAETETVDRVTTSSLQSAEAAVALLASQHGVSRREIVLVAASA